MQSLKNLKKDQHKKNCCKLYYHQNGKRQTQDSDKEIILKAAREKNNSLDKKDPQLDYQHISHRPGGNRMI